jgi:hypothetical protein
MFEARQRYFNPQTEEETKKNTSSESVIRARIEHLKRTSGKINNQDQRTKEVKKKEEK